MSSITAQQTELDLELVPKGKRFEIGICNKRINPGKKQREPIFQVVLDALALTPCYSSFRTTADVPEVYMHQFLDSIHKTWSYWEIKTIIDMVVDQMHQPWRTFATIINRSLSGKTTGLDKLRLSRDQILWGMYYKKNVDYVELPWEDFTNQIDNREPTRKSKRIKRHAKKSTKAPTRSVVIKETLVKSLSKKKENMTVEKRKGIDLLSKDEDDSNNEHDSKSKGSDQERDSGDDKAQSNSENGSGFEHKTNANESDKIEGEEDEGMNYTTNQFDDDVDLRRNEPLTTDEGFMHKEGNDAKITNVQYGMKIWRSHSIKS
nr:hypothetical protein [Tanacetum cinerariifolium]